MLALLALFFHVAGAYRCAPPPVARSRSSLLQRSAAPYASSNQLGVPVAINGGDQWAGWRVDENEMGKLVKDATSTFKPLPVMQQFHPSRGWLWRQWKGTIVRSVLRNEVKINVCWALICVLAINFWPQCLWIINVRATSAEEVITSLQPVQRLWAIGQTLVAFVLSFFLSQTYTVWRTVYSIARRVQGRLSDIGLLISINAERDETGQYTVKAKRTIDTAARYSRLFNMLFFASVTRQYAPLATPKGLRALVQEGSMTEDELDCLIETSSYHQTVASWLGTLLTNSVSNGDIGGDKLIAYQFSTTLTTLRAQYAQMADELSGRMPMAYTHLVQLFVDSLCLTAPLALVGQLGAFGAIAGTACVTLFYAGILDLAKMFLDPFDNEDYGGRSGIRLETNTLVQEVNALTQRWASCSALLPNAVLNVVQGHRRNPEALFQAYRERRLAKGDPGFIDDDTTTTGGDVIMGDALLEAGVSTAATSVNGSERSEVALREERGVLLRPPLGDSDDEAAAATAVMKTKMTSALYKNTPLGDDAAAAFLNGGPGLQLADSAGLYQFENSKAEEMEGAFASRGGSGRRLKLASSTMNSDQRYTKSEGWKKRMAKALFTVGLLKFF